MPKYRFRLSIGYPSAVHEDEIDFDSEPTEEELQEDLRDWANDYIEYWAEKIEDGDSE